MYNVLKAIPAHLSLGCHTSLLFEQDFPFNIEHGIEHHNVWSTEPLSDEIVSSIIAKHRDGWEWVCFVKSMETANTPGVCILLACRQLPPFVQVVQGVQHAVGVDLWKMYAFCLYMLICMCSRVHLEDRVRYLCMCMASSNSHEQCM
jgi:hypothetical protein